MSGPRAASIQASGRERCSRHGECRGCGSRLGDSRARCESPRPRLVPARGLRGQLTFDAQSQRTTPPQRSWLKTRLIRASERQKAAQQMQREVVFRPGPRCVLFWVRLATSVHFAPTTLLCRWSRKCVSAVRTLDRERKISQLRGGARGVVPGRPGYPAEAGGHAGTAARLYRHVSKQFSSQLWFWVTLQPKPCFPIALQPCTNNL